MPEIPYTGCFLKPHYCNFYRISTCTAYCNSSNDCLTLNIFSIIPIASPPPSSPSQSARLGESWLTGISVLPHRMDSSTTSWIKIYCSCRNVETTTSFIPTHSHSCSTRPCLCTLAYLVLTMGGITWSDWGSYKSEHHLRPLVSEIVDHVPHIHPPFLLHCLQGTVHSYKHTSQV